ncbi:MAG: alpha-glucuronidase family glycosyl hydrolase, partial [Planctomycetota bacterium]
MRYSAFTFLVLWLITPCSCPGQTLIRPVCQGQVGARGTLVDIVISPEAAPSETVAAKELSHYLHELYPNTCFEVVRKTPREADHVIYLGCVESFPQLGEHIGNKELTSSESYMVTTAYIDGRKVGIIFGSDPGGAMYGAYNLLEKLGCGFYLSYDTFPSGRQENFSFDGWELSDAPLVQDRIVFNWHNFLSGCSTWNLSD